MAFLVGGGGIVLKDSMVFVRKKEEGVSEKATESDCKGFESIC